MSQEKEITPAEGAKIMQDAINAPKLPDPKTVNVEKLQQSAADKQKAVGNNETIRK